MRERLITLAFAAGALLLFYVLLFPRSQTELDEIGLPLSTETRPDGYQALWRWFREESVPEISLRHRYDHLPSLLRKSTGNVLIVTLPQRNPMRAQEFVDLDTWVGKGNTLLIMAAIEDTPLWIIGADALFDDHLARMTGLQLVTTPQPHHIDVKKLTQNHFEMQQRAPHALTAGVQRVTALTALPARRSTVEAVPEIVPLELAVRSDTGDPTLWLLRRGAGQMILSAAASPFSNGAIGMTDNAQLLANILAWSLGPGGTVIFDDVHQGLTAYYDGKAFFADPRLHHTLEWILLLWLVFVIGALPLQTARLAWQPPGETAYVEASARYFAAVVPPSAVAQRLIEGFLSRFADSNSDGRSTSRFERFDTHAGISRRESATLRDLYTRACAGEPVKLVRLQNLLSRLQRIFE